MGIGKGATAVTKVYKGTSLISKVVKGATVMFEAASPWQTMRSVTMDSNGSGFSSLTWRQRIDAAGLTDVSGTKVRVSFPASTTSGLQVGSAYIGLEGVADYSFASTPTQLFFGGSAGFTIAAGEVAVSDSATLSLDGTADIVVSLYLISNLVRYDSTPDNPGAYKAANEPSTLTASGYSTFAADIISKIEVS